MSIELTEKQSIAWQYLNGNDELLSLLYGGAKGGGKSFFLCIWACQQAKTLAQLFNLQPSDNPIPVGFIGRKRAVDFNNTTLATWRRVIPNHHYEIKEQKKQIIIDGRVAIQFGGLDDQDSVNKFNSAEFVFACIDQAEETNQADIAVLSGSLRLKVNGIQPKYRLLYTANPAECWLKSEFDVSGGISKRDVDFDGKKVKYVYVPALFTDNKHLPDNYAATLEMAFGYDEALITAYKTGDWSLAHDSDFVVTRAMIQACGEKVIIPTESVTTAGCDPAIGGDECVMYVNRNGYKLAELISHEKNPMVIAGTFIKFCRDYGVTHAAIDTCGLGIGIGTRCREILGKDESIKIIFIQSAEKATDSRCRTMRDQVWLQFRERMMNRMIPAIKDDTIIEQLCAFKFKTENGRFKVCGKDALKQKTGSHYDRADAWVYSDFVQPMAKKEKMEKARDAYAGYERVTDWRAT